MVAVHQCRVVGKVSLLLNGDLNRRVPHQPHPYRCCDRPQYQEGWWLAPKNGWGPKEAPRLRTTRRAADARGGLLRSARQTPAVSRVRRGGRHRRCAERVSSFISCNPSYIARRS